MQTQWTNVPTTNKLRTIQTSIRPWKISTFENRKEETILTRLRLGHTKITHSNLKKQPTLLCSLCNLPLTIHHLLATCPSLSLQRTKNFKSPSLTLMLSDNPQKIKFLFNFLKSINLFSQI